MSKSILSVGLAVAAVAVAVFAPEVLPLIGVAAGSIGGLAITAAVEVGLALTSSLVLGPGAVKMPSTNPAERLHATLDTTTPRKFVLGDTAGATDVRYQEYTGSKQQYYEQIVAVASHTVNSIYELWIDNEKAWTSTGGVQGRFVNFLTVDVRNPGASGNGIAISSTWTANCTLTGCAYLHLKYLTTGPDQSTPSPFQSGVSSRLTVRTKGALVYDPRKDSTVTGGSGTQRANDQTTWAWDANGSRNPALQLLWYLLGWKINGKLAVGMGMPPSRIDLASVITAANHCDETVSRKAGGSEPRYRSDGVLSEGDDRSAVINTICATMNGTLRDAGGKISLDVIHDDTATPVIAFTLDDIIGDEQWKQTPALTDYHNIVRGRFVDPSDNALYQLSDYPSQPVTSPDGIDRIDAVDYPLVQSVTQAQRLAKLRLMRGQYQGQYTATFGPRAWGASIGNVVTLTHGGLSWTAKLFRVIQHSIAADGSVKMALLEENSAIYAWNPATDEQTSVSAGTPQVFNPSNNPLLQNSTFNVAALISTSSIIDLDPGSPVLTATDTEIFIKDHQRRYDDKTVSVTGNANGLILDEAGSPLLDESAGYIGDEGSTASPLSGLTPNTLYYIGYDDSARAGGIVTYVVSTNLYAVTNSGAGGSDPNMHFVGGITTATSGSSTTTTGGIAAPPGYTGNGPLP